MIRILVSALLAVALVGPAWAEATSPTDAGPFRVRSAGNDLTVVEWDAAVVRAATRDRRKVIAERFPLPGGRRVDLELEPFSVAGPRTRFVVAAKPWSQVVSPPLMIPSPSAST